ncbi:Abhydrolase_3 domain-containing protein, partial [Cephalotus follicularis]
LPWKVRIYLGAYAFGVKISSRPNLTVNRCLFRLFDPKVSPSKKPVEGVISSDTTIDATRNLWYRLFTPAVGDNVSLPVIFFFHGGGFAFFGPDSRLYHVLCMELARNTPAVVVSVNYRLTPENRHLCQCDDGLEALKFIDALKSDKFPSNADLGKCFMVGDSAGGNLAHHVTLQASAYEKFNTLKVIGLVAIQPYFGGEERTKSETRLVGVPPVSMEITDWFWKAFLPDGSDRDHPMANVFGPNSVDISGVKFPVALLFVGGLDPLHDWQVRYYEGLKKSGKQVHLVEYPNAIHAFYAFPTFPENSLFRKEVKDFIHNQL